MAVETLSSNGQHQSGPARPILEVERVSHSYGGVQAVNGVSFEIAAGTFYGLIGPNGAGKTTLIDCVSGVVRNYKGRVRFDGQDITGRRISDVSTLGLVRTFQASRLFGRMSLMSNVMSGPPRQRGEQLLSAILGGWQKEEAAQREEAWELLRRFDLLQVADNYGSDLSGGQRRLAELCRTLMTHPKMLLLDEPFAGVSPTNRARLAAQLRALCVEHGMAVLMVEHRLELVEQLCEQIIVMAEGRVIAQGTMAELRKDTAVISAYLGDVVTDGA